MSESTEVVVIRGEFITLGQLLKVVGEIDWGGGAKTYLAENDVYINGELDDRRGRKVRGGDVVDLPGGKILYIQSDEELES